MKYSLLQANQIEDPEGFESARFHTINYILHRGVNLLKTKTGEERLRPTWECEEFGTIVSNNFFYTYRIDPFEKDKDRQISIVVGCEENNDLEKEILILTNNTSLRKIINH